MKNIFKTLLVMAVVVLSGLQAQAQTSVFMKITATTINGTGCVKQEIHKVVDNGNQNYTIYKKNVYKSCHSYMDVDTGQVTYVDCRDPKNDIYTWVLVGSVTQSSASGPSVLAGYYMDVDWNSGATWNIEGTNYTCP